MQRTLLSSIQASRSLPSEQLRKATSSSTLLSNGWFVPQNHKKGQDVISLVLANDILIQYIYM